MADIMRIKVPTTKVNVSGDEADFFFFIAWTITTHTNYNTDAAGIRAGARLERAIEGSPAYLDLDLPDHKRLVNAVENPNGGYPVRPATRMLPFVEAVVEARPALEPEPVEELRQLAGGQPS